MVAITFVQMYKTKVHIHGLASDQASSPGRFRRSRRAAGDSNRTDPRAKYFPRRRPLVENYDSAKLSG